MGYNVAVNITRVAVGNLRGGMTSRVPGSMSRYIWVHGPPWNFPPKPFNLIGSRKLWTRKKVTVI